MLKEIPELRAPENKRTGMEIKPKVKCPDQTDDAIVPPRRTCHSDQADGLATSQSIGAWRNLLFLADYVTTNRLNCPELGV
jgi:hypothetical protein